MIVAEPVLEEFATNVAVTVTVGGLGALAGAVYFPVASIVPQLGPAQPVPDTPQLTAGIAPHGLPVSVNAVNCCTPLI
jgi:hypothetical protein